MPKLEKRKYCPNCGERIRHSASKCQWCGQRILTARTLLLYVLAAVLIVASLFLWLDYRNIEFFK
jgi:uncharacterized paraquat-inducible protein A